MRTREIGFDAKRKADNSMPVAAGDEREGGAKRNNPTAASAITLIIYNLLNQVHKKIIFLIFALDFDKNICYERKRYLLLFTNTIAYEKKNCFRGES